MAGEALAAHMTNRLVREGPWVAEVQVRLLDDAAGSEGWGPYLSLEDACKLDDIHEALRTGDIELASRLANKLYRLTPHCG